MCPANATGPVCGQSVYNTPITSSKHWEEAALVGLVVFVVLLLVLLFACCRRCTVRRTNKRAAHINNETKRKDGIVLNSNRSPDPDFKRGSKLSNLEVNQVSVTSTLILSAAP